MPGIIGHQIGKAAAVEHAHLGPDMGKVVHRAIAVTGQWGHDMADQPTHQPQSGAQGQAQSAPDRAAQHAVGHPVLPATGDVFALLRLCQKENLLWCRREAPSKALDTRFRNRVSKPVATGLHRF